MNKKILIGLILATLLLGMIPNAAAIGTISISSPTGQTYSRGDTVTISATSYAGDSIWTIQIQTGTTKVWIDQVTSAGSLSYLFTIPTSWGGGTYTIYVDGDNSEVESTTFVLSVPVVFLPITPPAPTVPTVAEVQAMTTTQAAETISKLSTQNAATIMTGLTTSKATAVIAKLNNTFVASIFNAAVEAGTTTDASTLMNTLDAERAGDLLLEVDPEAGAALVEAMTGDNLNAAALRVEEAVKRSGNAARLAEFGGSLVGVPAETLVSLFREIAGLPATPSTIAALFEVMPITKVKDVIDAWMETENYEDLALVFSYLSDAKLEEIYLTMSGAQRTTLYPYLDETTLTKLPEPGTLTISSLTITPSTVEVGEIVTIKVTVNNPGLIELSEGITLKIAGTSIESEMVTLMPDASQTLTWTVSEATAGTYNVDVNGLTGSFTVEAPPVQTPANIIYKSIAVSPTMVELGASVTVTVTVENTGDLSGSELIELMVNNVIADSETTTVAGGATKTISFTLTETAAGTYTLNAGGKTTSFTVTEPPPPSEGFPWIYLIAAVVIIAVAAYLYMQQQKKL